MNIDLITYPSKIIGIPENAPRIMKFCKYALLMLTESPRYAD